MREVININSFFEEKEIKQLKPIEFTHCLNDDKWVKSVTPSSSYARIIHLGKNEKQEDLFLAKYENIVVIYKGHLNDGVYNF